MLSTSAVRAQDSPPVPPSPDGSATVQAEVTTPPSETQPAQDAVDRTADDVRRETRQRSDRNAVRKRDAVNQQSASERSVTGDVDISARGDAGGRDVSVNSQFGAGLTFQSDGTIHVESVQESGFAARSGLRSGDQILSINGQAMRSGEQLQQWLTTNRAVRAEMRILRNGAEQTLRMAPRSRAALGVTFATEADQSLTIKRVSPGSPAAELGLRPGDRLIQLDGRQFSDVDLLIDAIGQSSLNEDVTVHWMRNGEPHSGTTTLAEWQSVYGQASAVEERTYFYRDGEPRGQVSDIAPPPDADAPPAPPALTDGPAPPRDASFDHSGPVCAPGSACPAQPGVAVMHPAACQPAIPSRCCRPARTCQPRRRSCCAQTVVRPGCSVERMRCQARYTRDDHRYAVHSNWRGAGAMQTR